VLGLLRGRTIGQLRPAPRRPRRRSPTGTAAAARSALAAFPLLIAVRRPDPGAPGPNYSLACCPDPRRRRAGRPGAASAGASSAPLSWRTRASSARVASRSRSARSARPRSSARDSSSTWARDSSAPRSSSRSRAASALVRSSSAVCVLVTSARRLAVSVSRARISSRPQLRPHPAEQLGRQRRRARADCGPGHARGQRFEFTWHGPDGSAGHGQRAACPPRHGPGAATGNAALPRIIDRIISTALCITDHPRLRATASGHRPTPGREG
jgi:hypothetical protein